MGVKRMKAHLSVLLVTAMLAASAGLTSVSFAQIVEPITVSTDKESYSS